MTTVLVTGGAGFIGSHLIRELLIDRAGYSVVNYDLQTYATDGKNLEELGRLPRYAFVRGDICDAGLLKATVVKHGVSAVINCAAETHVDRSISAAAPFVRTNVLGVQTLLETALRAGIERFLQVSTDEVYGACLNGAPFDEEAPLAPNNPYSASKASADLLCRAYRNTYGLPVVVARSVNNYGPGQNAEKLVPRMILRAIAGRRLPVYGDGLQVRSWIHVKDNVRALAAVLEGGVPGGIYNIGSNDEYTNLHIVRRLLKLSGRPEELIEYVKDRPGHDRRYAVDSGRIRAELGWSPEIAMEEGLTGTVEWYRSNAGRFEGQVF